MGKAVFALAWMGLVALGATGCATYKDQLARGERAFEASEDERALAIFRNLELDTHRLDDADRAHYAYLRGMTDFRMGYKSEARHWLAVAAALEQQTPDSLPADWGKQLGESLKALNEDVYTAGVESLSNTGVATKAKANDDDVPPSDPSKSPSMPPKADE